MAPRLTVIVSQSAQRDAARVDVEETLVAELMMSPGLDATLIGPIESILPDSTDFLCLSSFNHNIGFVSWLDQETVAAHWRRLGLAGGIGAPGGLVIGEGKPRIYFFRIEGSQAGPNVLRQLQELQADRSVRTVSIGLASSQTPNAADRKESAPAVRLPVVASTPLAKTPTRAEFDAEAVEGVARQAASRRYSIEEDEVVDEERWQDLDQLVDDLDAFDL
jgi:hypothetical protein